MTAPLPLPARIPVPPVLPWRCYRLRCNLLSPLPLLMSVCGLNSAQPVYASTDYSKCLSLCMYTVFIRILQLAILLQLTGELPFQPTEEDEIVAPDRVPHRHQSQWRQYEAIQRLYTHYVSTVCFSCHLLCGTATTCRNLLVLCEGV